MGGQFAPKSVVNLDWKVVVNLTVFSRLTALNLDGELDVLYEETENLEERVEFLDCLGNEDVSFYFDDEDLN